MSEPLEQYNYDSQEYTSDDIEYITRLFMNDLIEFRKTAAVKPIRAEPVNIMEAADMCSVATTGNNVSALLALQEEKDKALQQDWLERHIGQIVAILAVGALPLIAYILINR